MTCSVNLKGQTFLKGSTNFKISAIVDHERSVSHLKAASAFHASKRSNTKILTTTEAEKSLQALKQNERKRLNTLFRNAHAVMKHDRPLSDNKWLCSLDQMKGLDTGNTYINGKAALRFVQSIAKVESEKNS